MSAESAHLSTFGAETEAEIRSTYNLIQECVNSAEYSKITQYR